MSLGSGRRRTVKKVLLAADGSDGCIKAARVLGDLVAQMPEVRVTVLHVAQVPSSYYMMDEFGNHVAPEIPVDVMIRRSAEPVLRRTVSALGLPDSQVDTEVQVGEPAEEVVELARLEHYDLIVVGSRGLNPIKEMLLGSVSHRIVHTATCPVLVAR